ncbi:MAG: hypothetical protein MI862_23620 [Desulfobacterales bacterium]|nr:hypothetical protein [Desulfobacterales bacterium]
MTLGVKVDLRNGYLNSIRDAIDAGPGAGKIKIYSGTRPATGGAITSQVLLGTVLCSDPCSPNAASGVLTFSSFTDDDSADAGGTASWARITDSTDSFVIDASVGTSGADINLNSTNITAGGIIRITSGTLTAGNP